MMSIEKIAVKYHFESFKFKLNWKIALEIKIRFLQDECEDFWGSMCLKFFEKYKLVYGGIKRKSIEKNCYDNWTCIYQP